MVFTDLSALPARPPSEVEWEELLVRVEIAPRALRLAVEDSPEDGGVIDALRLGVLWERMVRAALEAMREGREASFAEGEVSPPAETEAAALLDEIARLRARTFAIAQRRGLDVWAWRARGGPFHGATAYQLLQATAGADRERLARIRGARGGGAAC